MRCGSLFNGYFFILQIINTLNSFIVIFIYHNDLTGITTAYESLEQGKVDAVIQDGPGAYFYIKTKPDSNLEVVGDEFNQGQAPYCVAISKECKYYDEINAAVKVLIDNGTTDELYAKWCE